MLDGFILHEDLSVGYQPPKLPPPDIIVTLKLTAVPLCG